MRRTGWAALAAAALVAAAFAYLNRYERVTVDLGAVSASAVPLWAFFFVAFLLGMAAMLLLSLPQDRRTRELLRAHGLLDAPSTDRPATDAAAPPSPPDPAPTDA